MADKNSFSKNPDVSWRNIDGQAVLIHNKLGEIQVLNEIGTYAWEHLDDDPEAVAEQISKDYSITAETAREDLAGFFAELIASGAAVKNE